MHSCSIEIVVTQGTHQKRSIFWSWKTRKVQVLYCNKEICRWHFNFQITFLFLFSPYKLQIFISSFSHLEVGLKTAGRVSDANSVNAQTVTSVQAAATSSLVSLWFSTWLGVLLFLQRQPSRHRPYMSRLHKTMPSFVLHRPDKLKHMKFRVSEFRLYSTHLFGKFTWVHGCN